MDETTDVPKAQKLLNRGVVDRNLQERLVEPRERPVFNVPVADLSDPLHLVDQVGWSARKTRNRGRIRNGRTVLPPVPHDFVQIRKLLEHLTTNPRLLIESRKIRVDLRQEFLREL